MDHHAEATKAELIDRVVGLVRDRLDSTQREQAERFVRQYYGNVPPDDVVDEELETLYGQALSLFAFVRRRSDAAPKVRAFNPSIDEHGWASEHTIVEILNDDMPFLVDSVTAELNRLGLSVQLVIHPVMSIARDDQGTLVEITEATFEPSHRPYESIIHVQVDEQSDTALLAEAEKQLAVVLAHVRAAVEDWQAMRRTCEDIIGTFTETPRGQDGDEIAEVRDFLQWLRDDHFTFLGYRTYVFTGASPEDAVPEAGLGVLRDPETRAFGELRNLATLPEEVRTFMDRRTALIVTKSTERARIHRPVPMDAIGIKQFSECGTEVVGLRLFIGLFTADVYTNSPNFVPVLKSKLSRVMGLSGLRPLSHDGRKLMNILENLPRDELFQMDEAQLLDTARGVLHLQERQRTALFLRQDDFQRFLSCLVFVPRDRFDTQLRLEIQELLERALDGTMETFSTQVTNAPLARVHFVLRTKPGCLPQYDVRELEKRIAEAARAWPDQLHDALIGARGEETGLRLYNQYAKAFPAGYRERFSAQVAVSDIERIEEALGEQGFCMNLYRSMEDGEDEVRFKIYRPGKALPLSEVLPMLENMGFHVMGEVPFKVKRLAERQVGDTEPPVTPVWIHDFSMRLKASGDPLDIGAVRKPFQECFARLWKDDVENDGFNALVVAVGIDWRQVVVLRAYARYLRQVGFTFSQATIEQALITHATITHHLVDLFMTRFDPAVGDEDRAAREKALSDAVLEGLAEVDNPDEDRILRRYLNLITSTLRTNWFQTDTDGLPKPYVSLKIASRQVEDLPLPRPWVEVFVYSPRVEAIHLRGGKVARGGIRWSDRREDFRTEILGLIKAQMVKNAVIVPVGSKGGFVVKRPPADGGREAQQAEGIECYKTLMRGLLDITDNLGAEQAVVPPPRVVRHDEDDPYLVVAADKGTATFSDIANGVSRDYGFWLDDAFASGGSNGYDHKAMGITAKGAWEAVKRHFREMGRDSQTEDFTCVGVGDMSGDVFGNGMLLSRHIRLVGAFNHMHIFVDPDPDAASSFQERERLFALGRSAWSDYDLSKLSKGGAIFERRAKLLTLTPEIKARFGLTEDKVPPTVLMNAILRAPVDLLWFGGIGTYVKAVHESDSQVGDRANDAIRVNGRDIRAKVVGEGANLGVTQLGRIEYALKGGRINTDAIDNSAGVDCSDHEVNIKILLNGVVAAGDMTEKQRNGLLTAMTDTVGALVLRDNYMQTQAISLVQHQAQEVLDHQARLMRALERAGRLDRDIEFLPEDDQLQERTTRGLGLTRPETSVVLPYAKMWLFDEILASDLPDDPFLANELIRYFPPVLGERFPEAIAKHRLRREILATVITNSMINRVGGTFVTQMTERTGLGPVDVARAYVVTRQAFHLREIWSGIEALDTAVSAATQMDMLVDINRLVSHSVLWLLRNAPQPLNLAEATAALSATVQALDDRLDTLLDAEALDPMTAHRTSLIEAGVPDALATRVAGLEPLAGANDIARIAAAKDLDIPSAARLYYRVGADFGMDWLRGKAAGLDRGGSHWTKLAVSATIEDLFAQQRNLTLAALDCLNTALPEGGETPAEADGADMDDLDDPTKALLCWRGLNIRLVERAEQVLAELRGAVDVDLAMLTVASRQFRALAGS